MGCGQSKTNQRRRKNSGKRNGAKKSGAIDNDAEEEEEEDSTGEEAPEEPVEEPGSPQHVLPIADHQPTFEVSMSQENFFKMLDEKVEQGKDYDSTSETEMELEEDRKRMLIEYWRSLSLSPQPTPKCSPPMAARSRLTRSVSKISERQCAPSTSRQSLRHETPARRTHGSQTGDSRPTEWEASKSPLHRTRSAGATRKSSSKVAPLPKQKDEPVAGCSKDCHITTTYNPTFQSHSPAHKSQPVKAQVTSHPLQQVAPPSPKVIAPPEEYQDPEADRQVTVKEVTSQSQIYYIHGSNAGASELEQQRQQTALRLQQYVAMKQAQQQMLTAFLQRSPHAHSGAPRMFEGEELAAQYGYPGPRPHSAPTRLAQEVAHLGMPQWSPLAPVAGAWQAPLEMQYYPQSQFMAMFRPGPAPKGRVQSLSVVRGKPVGQVVSLGAQELAVSAESPSPASASADTTDGMSPGAATTPRSATPPAAAPETELKPKKKLLRTLKISKSLDC